jgi:hypothetical protein
MLVAGTMPFGLSSLVGGLPASAAMLIGARLGQDLGAAMMTRPRSDPDHVVR